MRALAIACVLVGCATPTPAVDRALPVDGGRDAALASQFEDCARCHARAARDHAVSMHAQAFDDPLFQREWGRHRDPWCVSCHAPQATDADDPRVHGGVGCASCHVREDRITSTHASGAAPHATAADAHFADPARCAPCHEFDFDARPHAERLQRTLEEWRASQRTESCADCHMPSGSHRLRGPRDAALLADALDVDVEAERRGATTIVRATLRVRNAAHAVPTGDLHRVLVLSAWIEGAAPVTAEMSRLFERGEDGVIVEIADQRVLPGVDRRIELVVPAARRVHWSLVWHALAPDATRMDGIAPELHVREIASGELRVAR